MNGGGACFDSLNLPNKGKCAWLLNTSAITWLPDQCAQAGHPRRMRCGCQLKLLASSSVLWWLFFHTWPSLPPVKQPGDWIPNEPGTRQWVTAWVLMMHTMAPRKQLIIAAQGRLLLLSFIYLKDWPKHLMTSVGVSKDGAFGLSYAWWNRFYCQKNQQTQFSNQHEHLKSLITAFLQQRWHTGASTDILPSTDVKELTSSRCNATVFPLCVCIIATLCSEGCPLQHLVCLKNPEKRGCAFCDMSLFPQSNSAEAQQSAQCLMRFALTVFFLWPLALLVLLNWWKCFLCTNTPHTVGKVWGIVSFLEQLSVFEVMVVWVYRIVAGEEALEQNNGPSQNPLWRGGLTKSSLRKSCQI